MAMGAAAPSTNGLPSRGRLTETTVGYHGLAALVAALTVAQPAPPAPGLDVSGQGEDVLPGEDVAGTYTIRGCVPGCDDTGAAVDELTFTVSHPVASDGPPQEGGVIEGRRERLRPTERRVPAGRRAPAGLVAQQYRGRHPIGPSSR